MEGGREGGLPPGGGVDGGDQAAPGTATAAKKVCALSESELTTHSLSFQFY